MSIVHDHHVMKIYADIGYELAKHVGRGHAYSYTATVQNL